MNHHDLGAGIITMSENNLKNRYGFLVRSKYSRIIAALYGVPAAFSSKLHNFDS